MSSCWSISDSTVNQVYKEPVLGWLEVCLNFIESSHTLECTVIRARDLQEMDIFGLADPFCKLNILSPDKKMRHSRWMRTKTSHKTRNPEFNETIQFIGIESEYLVNSTLYVVVLDDDRYGHDFLGASKFNLSPVGIFQYILIINTV